MSFNKDMTDYKVLERYDYANKQVITVMDSRVFSSLQDVPDLIKERELLKRENQELKDLVEVLSAQDFEAEDSIEVEDFGDM